MESINDILSNLSPSDVENLKGMAEQIFSGESKEVPESLNLGLLSSLTGVEDERCALISSLKPMLSDERKKRADDAIKLLKAASLIPLLKNSSILDKFLEGF